MTDSALDRAVFSPRSSAAVVVLQPFNLTLHALSQEGIRAWFDGRSAAKSDQGQDQGLLIPNENFETTSLDSAKEMIARGLVANVLGQVEPTLNFGRGRPIEDWHEILSWIDRSIERWKTDGIGQWLMCADWEPMGFFLFMFEQDDNAYDNDGRRTVYVGRRTVYNKIDIGVITATAFRGSCERSNHYGLNVLTLLLLLQKEGIAVKLDDFSQFAGLQVDASKEGVVGFTCFEDFRGDKTRALAEKHLRGSANVIFPHWKTLKKLPGYNKHYISVRCADIIDMAETKFLAAISKSSPMGALSRPRLTIEEAVNACKLLCLKLIPDILDPEALKCKELYQFAVKSVVAALPKSGQCCLCGRAKESGRRASKYCDECKRLCKVCRMFLKKEHPAHPVCNACRRLLNSQRDKTATIVRLLEVLFDREQRKRTRDESKLESNLTVVPRTGRDTSMQRRRNRDQQDVASVVMETASTAAPNITWSDALQHPDPEERAEVPLSEADWQFLQDILK